jgi:hypothetical protein
MMPPDSTILYWEINKERQVACHQGPSASTHPFSALWVHEPPGCRSATQKVTTNAKGEDEEPPICTDQPTYASFTVSKDDLIFDLNVMILALNYLPRIFGLIKS